MDTYNYNQIIDCYEQMLPVTAHMLALARLGEWDALYPLEKKLQDQIDFLKTIDRNDKIEESQREKKHQLLKKILADNAEILNLAAPKLEQLSQLMNNLRMQQTLNHTYSQ